MSFCNISRERSGPLRAFWMAGIALFAGTSARAQNSAYLFTFGQPRSNNAWTSSAHSPSPIAAAIVYNDPNAANGVYLQISLFGTGGTGANFVGQGLDVTIVNSALSAISVSYVSSPQLFSYPGVATAPTTLMGGSTPSSSTLGTYSAWAADGSPTAGSNLQNFPSSPVDGTWELTPGSNLTAAGTAVYRLTGTGGNLRYTDFAKTSDTGPKGYWMKGSTASLPWYMAMHVQNMTGISGGVATSAAVGASLTLISVPESGTVSAAVAVAGAAVGLLAWRRRRSAAEKA